jgi:hypothetical protein
MRIYAVVALFALAACDRVRPAQQADGGGPGGHQDAPIGPGRDSSSGGGDSGGGMHDAMGGADAHVFHDAAPGVISGGPCASGAAGQTAYRIRWENAGGEAQVVYLVDGLPDHTRDHAAAYGYQIGFTPSFVDPFLGDGGLGLDDSDFVDLEITTAGVSTITSATLSIYGRSYDTTTSGSFNWQTFVGTGASPTDSVSNVAPYQWYSADMTTEIAPEDSNTLIRIKAGLSSDSLVVNQIELCLVAS